MNKVGYTQTVRIALPENVQKLFDTWIDAVVQYYGDPDNCIMSDVEFDALQQQLVDCDIKILTKFVTGTIYNTEKQLFYFVKPESRSVSDFVNQQMISLFKIKWKSKATVSDIVSFFGGNKTINSLKLMYAPKFDGAALKVVWDLELKKIKIIQTRGGLNVTDTFKNMKSITDTIKYGKPVIAGELVVNKKIFNQKYSILSNTDNEYENARNFVGAIVKKQNIDQEIIDDLHYVPCTDGINYLENAGIWSRMELNNLYSLDTLIERYKSDNFPYLCDGIVLGFTETGERQVKNNYPLNLVSVKFRGVQAKTHVIDMFYTQKKTGKLTPMLLIDPVQLDGITATRANGYNYGKLIENGIGIGAEIIIERSGDIIPVVASVVKKVSSIDIKMPDVPYKLLGKHLIAVDNEESRKYKFTLGLRVLDIGGIGDVLSDTIGSVIDYDIIKLFDTEYKPNINEAIGGGANWLRFKSFYEIKTLSLDLLIQLLQFNDVGPIIAKKLALLLTKQSTDIANMSSDVLNNVARGDGYQKIMDAMSSMKSYGIKITKPVIVDNKTISFEMTGDPKASINMSKSDFIKKFKEIYPNSDHTTLVRTTKLLICDDISGKSGKCNKARKYNVPMVTYADALNGKLPNTAI